MSFPLTLPQAPVAAGESGHLNDHDLIQAGLATLWGAAEQSTFNVKAPPYNATGNGTTDDTVAIQAAITACSAAGGGVVYFPAGTYLVTPSGSPSVGLSLMGTGSAGMQNVRLVGAGNQAATVLKNGSGTLLQLSGPSTSPSTGSTHIRYCTVESLGFNGNGKTGPVFQCYYADNLEFRDVYVNGNADIVLDSAEFWDSRFYNCVFGGSGGATANASTPNCYIRNSAAASGFGNSAGTTNMIVFHGCRWEGFTTGALWIVQGTGGTGGPNSIFVTDCKMESSTLNGGPHLSVDTNSRGVFVKHLYAYSGGWSAGYTTANDMIDFSPQSGTLDDVLLSDGSSATVASGITVNSPALGETVTVENITATWTTNPTGALINYGGTAAGTLTVENVAANAGALVAGTVPTLSGGVAATATVANTAALTNLESLPLPGGQARVGSMYRITGYGVYSTTGTPTLGFQLYWGSTNIGTIPGITTPSGITNASFKFSAEVTFRSATSCTADIEVRLGTSTSTYAASAYLNVPTGAVGVTTSSSQNLTVASQWSVASASNTISLLGGGVEKVY